MQPPRAGRASTRLDHGFFFEFFGRASDQRVLKISDSVLWTVAGQRAFGHDLKRQSPHPDSGMDAAKTPEVIVRMGCSPELDVGIPNAESEILAIFCR